MPDKRHDESIVPAPLVDVNTMLQKMVEGMFHDVRLDEHMQSAIEKCLHDQKGKLQLMLAGVVAQHMMSHSKLAAGAQYAREMMADPEYTKIAWHDPEVMRRHTESLHKMEMDRVKFCTDMLKNLLDSTRGSGGAAFDPQQQFNFLFAEGSSGLASLPEQLQDRNKRRQFTERVATAMALMEDSIPDAPQKRDRLRDAEAGPIQEAEIIDVQPQSQSPEAEKGEPDDDAFWNAMGVKE